MGSNCSCDCGKPNEFQQSAPDTRPERRPTKGNNGSRHMKRTNSASSSEDEYDEYDSDDPSKYLDTIDTGGYGSSNDELSTPTTRESKEKAIIGYKEAINRGNESLVMYYVEEFPELDLLSLKFENSDNCLQVAVRNASYKLIYYLLSNNLSPNAQNPENGESALHTAVRTRDVKVVALLCKYSADPAITNRNFETPLTIASENRDDDIIELLAPDTQEIIRERLGSIDENAPMLNYTPTPNKNADALGFPSTSLHAGQVTNSAVYHELAEEILNAGGDLTPTPNTVQSVPEIANNDAGSLAALSSIVIARDNTPETKMADGPESNSFERGLTDGAKLKLNAVRVANTNPFSALKRNNTKKVLGEIQAITENKGKLPVLEAWLEKKSTTMKGYQKRWVIVKGSYLLWSDMQRDIKDVKNIKERKKWNNSLNIMSIKDIQAVKEGKTQRKFKILIGTTGRKPKRKEYLWKCATKEDRDFWVDGVKKHISHMKSVLSYLGTK